jgi:hypothetical protein
VIATALDLRADTRRFEPMSRFAALMMVLAWMLYGAMPAIGMPSMPMQGPPVTKIVQHHAEHGNHDMASKPAEVAHSHGAPAPCPHGGKVCSTPFCAACLTLLTEVATGENGRFVYAYPAPAVEQALASPDPAPLTPPPRS